MLAEKLLGIKNADIDVEIKNLELLKVIFFKNIVISL
jgi:hypothetical protein